MPSTSGTGNELKYAEHSKIFPAQRTRRGGNRTERATRSDQTICKANGKIDPQALDSCTITPKKVSLCYDPTRTSRNHIVQLVQQIGGKPRDIEIAGSPLLEQ
jgi:hypothetical protein